MPGKPLLAGLVALLFAGLAEASPRIHATGLDAVTTPGVPVRIRAKFEWRLLGYLRPDLVREPVVFSVLGRRISDLTDFDGVAEATVVTKRRGVHRFEARLSRRPGAPLAHGKLYVVDPRRPVAVVDIDGTLSDMSGWRVSFSGDRAPTFPGAVALLRDLARSHRIVYLTARDDALQRKTRAFLSLHGFPSGPLLMNDWGLSTPEERRQLLPFHHGRFKLRVLRALRARGLRLQLGIGDQETDAWAYEKAGLRSTIRTVDPGEGKSFHFASYSALRVRLVKEGVLPPKDKTGKRPRSRAKPERGRRKGRHPAR